MRIAFVAAAVLLAAPTVVAAKSDKPAKEKKICRSVEQTGTRFSPPPVCKTAAEWAAGSEAARRDMELRQRSDYNASEVNGSTPR
jgi:hypothetical protein